MAQKRQLLVELDQADNCLLERIAAHMRLPLVYVVRIALRHYALTGDWPIGTNGYREQVLEEVRAISTPKKRGAKA